MCIVLCVICVVCVLQWYVLCVCHSVMWRAYLVQLWNAHHTHKILTEYTPHTRDHHAHTHTMWTHHAHKLSISGTAFITTCISLFHTQTHLHTHTHTHTHTCTHRRTCTRTRHTRTVFLSLSLAHTLHTHTHTHKHTHTSCTSAIHTHERVMSHKWMSHVTHINTLRDKYKWVLSHTRMRHVTHRTESCRTYEWVVSHTGLSHVALMNESCHTQDRVTSHVWMRHVTHRTESCRTYKWVMSHTGLSYVALMSALCHTFPTHRNEASQAHEYIPVTRTNESRHKCAKGQVTDMKWVMSHTGMSHVALMNKSRYTHEWVTSHIQMRHVTYMNAIGFTHEWSCVCVCCFVLLNRYWGIVTVPGSIHYGSRPVVAGSSPCTLTTSCRT